MSNFNWLIKQLYSVDPYSTLEENKYEIDLRGWGSEDQNFSSMIDKFRPSLIIEVGTWKGASAVHSPM